MAVVGMTQVQLANKLRRPQSFVSKYENGERRLDVVEFLEIMKALSASPERFLRAIYKRI
jgi:transcriptional regulator with XRE-family HTH domain